MIAETSFPHIALILVTLAAGAAVLRYRSALREARDRVVSAERLAAARGRCLSLAAQELRGPGLALLGHASRLTAAERRQGVGDTLEVMAQQVLRLADDLADFATEPSPRTIHDAPAPLGPLVDAAVAAVSAQIRPGRRHWQIDPEIRRLTVRADRRALENALAALLRRAARHSRDGDVIALRHEVAPETLALVIEDEGDGLIGHDIATETAGVMSGTRGLDLGLSLARSLAAAHGGDIRLESAPGIGARAWLTLPRARLLEAA
jgi:signal transduction histidine kinase